MAELANNVQQQSSTATDPSDAQEKPLETTQQDEQIIESNWDEAVATFDDMELDEKLLRGIYAYGFEKPSAIQQRGIIPILKGYDSIAQAQSGTGKTATFAISILQSVNMKEVMCQALVLAPTRELASQIQKVIIALGDYMQAKVHACVGGTDVKEDIRMRS